jgi:FkbM family methyltransferase
MNDDVRQSLAKLESKLDQLANDVAFLKRTSSTYLGENTVLTYIDTGQPILVDGRDRGAGAEYIKDAQYEPWLSRQILSHIRPGVTFVDVGALFGYYSIVCGPRLRPGGRGFAFEPNPTAYKNLIWSLYFNGIGVPNNPESALIKAHPVGCSNERGRMCINSSPETIGGGRVTTPTDDPSATIVEVVDLDGFLPPDITIDVMKIDVEGHELMVFEGMRNILRRSKQIKLFMEFFPAAILSDEKTQRVLKLRDVTDIKAYLKSLEFQYRWIDRGTGNFLPVGVLPDDQPIGDVLLSVD